MRTSFFYFILFLFISPFSFSFSQVGSVTGVVSDADNSEPLIGATVSVENTSIGTVTDLDGQFQIDNLAAGTYTLKVSYIGYDSKLISAVNIVPGEVYSLTVTLGASNSTLDEVVITAEARKETISSMLTLRKNSSSISDMVSADMIRKSPDKNTSDVLKRVSGVTIQDNKFVVVRGMNDRYNAAMLNGSILPSSEPDRKTFSFDIFPSSSVDNITVVKSATPDLPGDFSGGLIQINTKEIPDKNFLSAKIGGGYHSLSTFKSYYTYEGGNLDWLGVDEGTRGLPDAFPTHDEYVDLSDADKIEAAQLLSNKWAYNQEKSMPFNPSLQLAGGFNLSKNNYPVFGGTFAITHNDSRKFTPSNRFDYNGISEAISDTIYKFNDSAYQRNTLNNALADIAFKLNPNNKFFFNNIYSINAIDQIILRDGYSFSQSLFLRSNSFYFSSNKILNSQLGGEHFIKPIQLKIKWQGYHTSLNRDEPDYRRMLYQTDDLSVPSYVPVSTSPSTNTSAGFRYFGEIIDKASGANLDLSFSFKLFNQSQALKFGGAYYYDERTRDVRVFSAGIADGSSFDYSLYNASQDTIFSPEHFNDKTGFVLNEDESPTNHYDGNIESTAGYLMFDNKFSNKIRLVWGLRIENYHNVLNTFDQNNFPYVVDTAYLDLLPSGNLILSILKDANLRFTFSRSLARPSYRELANAPFYDFNQNITYYGNPVLVETHITNYETRWEHYFANAQYYSISGFYKNFINPIEQNLFVPGADNRSVQFLNIPEATNVGIEIEGRKNLDFVGKGFEHLYAYANVAYIKSKVFVQGTTSDTSANRPLEGQSPLVVNASLQYQEPKTNFGVSLMMNSVGRRLFLVGSVSDEPVWQKMHPVFDLKLSKSFLKNGLVEFTWSDVFHGDDILYHDLNGDQLYDETQPSDYTTGDRLISLQQYGTSLSLSVSYKL